jgi:hypothetical protein
VHKHAECCFVFSLEKHNINGSQVTGESPFEIWLNEAVTVYIQRQRENALFGADYMRLKEVLYSFTPGQGPLAIDAGPTAMPIEPKGFNRTQELISCFPSTDHQVLTSLGWMYLSDVQSHFSTAGLLHIACHELDGTLVYKPITPADVVVQEGQHVLVDISVSSTNLSLRPTANHVMYGQLGWMDNANHWMPTGSTAPTERHFAADLVASVHNRPASDGDVVFRPPAYFAQGVATSSPLPFAQELGLTSSAHVKGFLQFYGFFLGSGHWTPAMQLQFTIKLSAQREVFREIMSRTPLQENTDWTDYPDQTDKGHRYVITNVAWNTVLFRLHGHGQQVNRRRVAVAADPDDDEADDQRHWIAEFAFTHLNKKQARYVLEAMRQARNDGSEAGHQQIGVRSERFKNDLERLMIHAGYSVTIDPNGAYGFKVQYSDDAGSALPIVRPLSHVTPMEYVGTVWCVTVPAPNLIMFRRVAAEDEDGNVLKASRGVIVGNSTTYSKAPEFVNMIESLIGTATFNRGLDLYHTKYSYANATTNDWIRSMEETSGKSLMKMADLWLRRNGHPHVVYSGEYDATKKEYTVKIEQQHLPARDPTPWIVPIDYSLVKDGRLMKEGLFVCEKEKDSFTITDVSEKPDFLSFARGWSFFGTHSNSTASVADLSKQALTDPDIINRYFAYRAVVDAEKGRIIDALVKGDASHVVSPDVAKLHAAILFDSSVTAGARAAILREGEDIHTRPDLSFRYWEISNAKQALLQAVFDAHGAEVLALYQKLQSENRPGPHIDQLHQRALKHHLFTILAAGVNKKSILSTRKLNAAVQVDISALAKDLLSSSFMTDKLFAFSQFLSGPASSAEKQSVMEQVKKQFSAHPDSIESYIGVITGLDSEDAPTLIRALLKDALFDVNLAGHARTAVRMWAGIRKRSLLTDDGLALTGELFLLIGRVNQYSAQSFISALNDLAKFEPAQQKKIVAQFRQVLAGLDQVKEQSLFNQLSATLSPYKEV